VLQICDVSAVVGVDAELDVRSVNDVSETENVIVSQWREVSADEQLELRHTFDEILRPLGFKTRLLVMSRANSIALYFICLTLSAVMSLRDHWRTGQLDVIVQKLFTLLYSASRKVGVKRLIWPVLEYEQCLDFLRSVQGEEFSAYLIGLIGLSTLTFE